MEQNFETFKQQSLDIVAPLCCQSREMFGSSQSVIETIAALRHFWIDMLKEVPGQVIAMFNRWYEPYRADINAAGVYYNEPPTNPQHAFVLISDHDTPIHILNGRPRVYILGRGEVALGDHAQGDCRCAKATVRVRDHASLDISAGRVIDEGHKHIVVTGEVEVESHTTKNILLFGKSATIKKPEQ